MINHNGDANKMVSDTPRMDSVAGHARGIVDAAILAEGMKLERELNAANKRISWLESAVQDSIDACERDIGILQQRMTNLKTAKEAKP